MNGSGVSSLRREGKASSVMSQKSGDLPGVLGDDLLLCVNANEQSRRVVKLKFLRVRGASRRDITSAVSALIRLR
jgi:hypothetical protein